MKDTMAKAQYYKQCKLQMKLPGGLRITTSWIPEHKAVLGKSIHLEPRGEDRTGPWEVVHVSVAKQELEETIERSRDYTKQRKASDV